MVNQDIFNYLKEGRKRGFSMNLLKQKLLEGGFDEREVNEAAGELDKQMPSQQPAMNMPGQPSNSVQVKKGIEGNDAKPLPRDGMATKPESAEGKKAPGKWMKIAGWFGIAMLLLIIVTGILEGIIEEGVLINLSESITFSIIALVIFIFLTFFYYYGFYKMGQSASSGKFRFSSIAVVILLLLILIVGLAAQMTEAIQEAMMYVAFGLILILGIMQLIFSLGLIGIGGKVKFAKSAGWIGIVGIILSVVAIVLLIVGIISSDGLTISGAVDIPILWGLGVITKISIVLLGLFGLLMLVGKVLQILALFNGSKNFEI